jgi:DNA segregation ATPase FtsK/SpoIIIE, S-DNA-T family
VVAVSTPSQRRESGQPGDGGPAVDNRRSLTDRASNVRSVDVTITAISASTGVSTDVRLASPDTDPAGPLLDDVRRLVGAGDADPVHVEGRRLDSAGTTGACELADGYVLRIGPCAAATDAGRRPDPGRPVLAVVAGPGAGTRLTVAAAGVTVGRDPECELRLDDAAVSRRHLMVTAVGDGAGVLVEDLGSRNRTTMAGRPLDPGRPVRVEPGASIRVGASELTVVGSLPGARLVPTTGGRLAVHRSPRTPSSSRPVEFRLPADPAAPTPTRLPVLGAVAPLVVGVLLAVVLQQWQLLAFTVLSPVMVAGQAASDRLSSRRTHRAALAEHARQLAATRVAIDTALAEEQVRRRAAAPDLASLVGAAVERTGGLWQRGRDDPDAMLLRLGRGEPASEVTVVGEPARPAVDVPVCVPLRDVGVLGVAGPVPAATAVARSLVMQAVTLHGPGHCRLAVIAPGRVEEWAWVRWLPHTLPSAGEPCRVLIAADEPQARARLGELAAVDPHAHPLATVLLVDATAAPGTRPLDDVLDAVAGRCHTVWLAGDPARLPAGCRAVVTVENSNGNGALLSLTGCGPSVHGIRPDLPTRDVAEVTARSLAPLRDAEGVAAAAIPTAVSWSDIAGLDLTDLDAAVSSLTRFWLAGPSTAVPLGRAADGDVSVDLAVDGPHALVAGTTGSGKSELLQSLVAGLAATNRPEDLALLLVDFKGGAAFGSCRRFPHTVGVVTDLDTASTGRALTSLDAELRRRERVLAGVGVADLAGYAAAATRVDSAPPRPPRLVIVVDEFATLAEELPDFVGGLVGIAQRGRSLGVHLVLATQRPEGVVSADIRANTRLRICLAVARDSDSRDVIDGPQAATIGRDTPGRAYLRAGPGELTVMQTARVSGGRTSRRPRATLSPAALLGNPPARAVPEQLDRSDLDRLADAAIETAARLGCATPAAPWLPPLPDWLSTGALPAAPLGQSGWGLVDLPEQQRQLPLILDHSTGGTLLLAGTARSGRTTALRSLVLAVAAALPPERLHVWAVDGGGGLASLDALAHCGGVVPAYDIDRLDRLLTRTAAEVARRRRDGWAGQPLLLLAVDGWDAMVAQAGDHDGGRLVESLLRLATDGPAAGLRLVITSGRSGLTGRLGAVASDRLVLRLPDRSDFGLLGMAVRDVPAELPPGRAIRGSDHALVQIAVPDDATLATAMAWRPPAQSGVRRVDPLPEVVSLDNLAATGSTGHPTALRLGLRADDHTPALHDLVDGGGALLVAGPPRSGRSSALLLVAGQQAGREVAVVCPRRSPLAAQGERLGAVALPADDQGRAAEMLDAMTRPDGTPPVVLVDDVDLLGDGPLADRLAALARLARDGRALLVLAGPTEALIAAFRGPIAEVRRGRAGLLLQPSGPHDGELFGIRLPRRDASHDPPGRGWLAGHGEAVAIQVAAPPEPGSGGSDHLVRHYHRAGLLG